MKNTKIIQLLTMVIAASTMGARGLACIGDCRDYTERAIIPLLPPSSGGDAGVAPTQSTQTLCDVHCPQSDSCKAATIVQPDGTTISILECESHHACGAGRRPEGLTAVEMVPTLPEAQWLDHAAYLEAASIHAFRLLRRDLHALGAPRALLRQASRAAREEKRHTRRMRALAKRQRIAYRVPMIAPTPIPSLEQMALQNAVEGCIREAYGAVVARYQGIHAQHREIAATMKRIATDEAYHAAFAYRIDAWANRRLGREARLRIDRERDAAARELLRDAATAVPSPGRIALGLPDTCTALALARSMLEVLQTSRAMP